MIIVDNGSTDETSTTIAEFADRLPLRGVMEPVAGLSNARNTGVRAAKGDYICWTDDDVELDPQWLAAYARAFERYPDGTIFGGVVEPVYEVTPPPWMIQNADLLADVVAKRDHGPQEQRLSADQNLFPYGANYAVRTSEQQKCLYDPNLGVSPNQKRLGEETAVLVAIAELGGAYYWVPESRVRHLIPASRMSFDYIERYFESVGETWAYLSLTGGAQTATPIALDGRKLAGVPIWIWRKSITAYIIYRVKRALRLRPSLWLEDLIQKSRMVGARRFLLSIQ
jgi:glycosyltransferase involved in cell wall biosynthesis